MPDELPDGWAKTNLGEVCLPVASIQPRHSPNAEFTYFDIGCIDSEGNHIVETKTVTGRNAPSRARQALRKDDILFSTVRTYLRKIARLERDYPNPVASTGFAVIRAAEGVSPQFLFLQILTEGFLQPLHVLQSGTSYPAVRPRDVFAQPILLPPTREQEGIVAKVDAALSRLIRAETAARRARERVQRYRAAVLHAAVTGELTRSWREAQRTGQEKETESGEALLRRLLVARRARWEEAELKRLRAADKEAKDDKWKSGYREPGAPITAGLPKLPEGWTWASPEQTSSGDKYALAIGPFGSDLRVSDYQDSGVPLIFVRNIREGVFTGAGTSFVSNGKADELKAHQVIGGDILITKTGDPPGDACLYPEGAPIAVITADCIRLHLPQLLEKPKPFFVHSINSTLCRDQILQITKGVAQQKVSLSRFSRIALPLPPLAEQTEIVREVESRLSAADKLAAALERQMQRSSAARQSLLQDALAGRLVPQSPEDEPASLLLERIRVEKARKEAERKEVPRERQLTKESKGIAMKQTPPSIETLRAAWQKIGNQTDARRLFDEAGFVPGQVVQFYEALGAIPELRAAFQEASQGSRERQEPTTPPREDREQLSGRFRLIELWLEDFKNLKDYTVRFDRAQSLAVILGWNGTGKSNLFEALIIIFRDLHEWWDKNRWPDKPMNGFRLSYEMDEHTVEVAWRPGQMKRPDLKRGPSAQKETDEASVERIRREQLPLPRFVFGYYSGPTNRLAEHFLPTKQAHYERLRVAAADDPKTLAKLLEQRRFFCAETYQAKYVLLWFLLGFSHREDPEISEFLANRLRIVGFESVLFVMRKPRWAKQGSKAEDFWNATGIMRFVMERLRRYAIAPMVLKQKVSYGYRLTTEDHYYFFLPDLKSLRSFAAAYQDAQTFFMALESTDFSELIHDVKIQVRVKASNTEEVAITFHQLSEGEQQLLMVLGLIRFTKSHQSLVLLDEPDTHLNPQWSVAYLKDLAQVMSDNALGSAEQQTSQILIATHDPLVIASLVKEQVHLLKRDPETLRCYWEQASENPRGLGFTGILTSEMFGFRSDLDLDTLELLDKQVDLAGKDTLSREEASTLETITQQVEHLGFKSASSDPYYRAFIKAVVRRQGVRNLLLKPTLTKPDIDVLKRETTEILAELDAEEAKPK